MKPYILYRKRFIPFECVQLKDDEILESNDEILLTRWNALHTRCDELAKGYSCCYLNRGIRVSKFLREDGSLILWYFDIVTYEKNPEENSLTIIDLLADVVVTVDGKVKVLDLDELSEAFETKLIDEDLLKKSLLSLSKLLKEIYSEGIEKLTAPITQYQSIENVSSDINS